MIPAVAQARLGDRPAAERHFQKALESVPPGFADREFVVTVEKGLLWLDTRSEFEQLRELAEQTMKEAS